MRITANNASSRATLTRLLVKIDQNPEYSRQIGVEDTSRFRHKADLEKKEVNENAELIIGHPVCGHSF